MPRPLPSFLALTLALAGGAGAPAADEPPPISERALRLTRQSLVFDGHNDLPWRLRVGGDVAFGSLDIKNRLPDGQTDIPRLRDGGLSAQFWSVYIPSNHPDPARTVLQQIDLVHRMVERYPADLALALTADDVERIVEEGKIASLIGIEGGVAIEGDLALLRDFYRLGARYMTLTHNANLPWADAATDAPEHDGLTPFGERVVGEMNRLGMLVDISHVAPSTMADALRVSKAPVIASHSSAFAVAPHPRNVPDEILRQIPANGGVIMVNFFSGFVVADYARASAAARRALREQHPDPDAFARALDAWYGSHDAPRGTVADVVDHIDHIVAVAGIDHVGLGGDFDGVTSVPVGLEDVSCYPRIVDELLRRGYSEADIRKILGGNALRALRRAGRVADELRRTTAPDVDPPPAADREK